MSIKNKISESFSEKAKSYNQNAVLQKSIAENLIEFSKEEIQNSSDILDIGSGTGFIAKIVKEKFGKNIIQSDISSEMCKLASIYGEVVCCDFDKLPFKKESFDMIISSCALQWSLNLEKTLAGFNKILKNNGNLSFSIFGKRTFQELKNFPVNKFLSSQKIRKSLEDCGFQNIKIKTELVTENISLKELFGKMSDIGADVNLENKKLKKSDYKKLLNNYKNQITWEVYYIKAMRK